MSLVKQACLPLLASIFAPKCSLVRVPDELIDVCAAWAGVENARPGLGAVHRMGHKPVGLREVDVGLVVAEPPGWVAELPFELLTAEVESESVRYRPAGPLEKGADWMIGELAHRIGVTPRHCASGNSPESSTPHATALPGIAATTPKTSAMLNWHLLRRGGYLLADIAPVLAQVREAGGPALLAESLAAWRQRLTSRSHATLIAAGHLADYLQLLAAAPSNDESVR